MYSIFPAGAPGAALLLLRLTAAAVFPLFISSQQGFGTARVRLGLCIVACALMCLGLFTPICAATIAAVEAITLCAQWKTQSSFVWLWIPVSVSIVLLGPGAFSIDALLFGRQIIRSSLDDHR